MTEQMRARAAEAVAQAEMTDARRGVLLAAVEHADRQGVCRAGAPRLAAALGRLPGAVTDDLDWLEAAGWARIDRATSDGRRNGGRANRVRLDLALLGVPVLAAPSLPRVPAAVTGGHRTSPVLARQVLAALLTFADARGVVRGVRLLEVARAADVAHGVACVAVRGLADSGWLEYAPGRGGHIGAYRLDLDRICAALAAEDAPEGDDPDDLGAAS